VFLHFDYRDKLSYKQDFYSSSLDWHSLSLVVPPDISYGIHSWFWESSSPLGLPMESEPCPQHICGLLHCKKTMCLPKISFIREDHSVHNALKMYAVSWTLTWSQWHTCRILESPAIREMYPLKANILHTQWPLWCSSLTIHNIFI
jgi:hypothetical protein